MLVDLVQIQTRDGVRLEGAWRETTTSKTELPFDALCLIHGTGNNFYSSTFLTAIVDHFNARGCPGLCVNTRGHDGISTAATSRGGKRLGAAYEVVDDCRHDLRGWLDFLEGRGRKRILLVGHSLGAVKSLYAIAQEPHPGVAALVAISPPLLSYQQFVASSQGAMFLETFRRAERFVAEGQPGAILEVQLPLPMVITAGGYVEKYGPDERYNYLRFLRGAPVSSLIVFGGQEVETNMAFQGCPESVAALAAVERRVEVQTVPSADHFYTSKRPELLSVVENWLRNPANLELNIRERDLDSADVADLLRQAQLELSERYPEDDPHPKPLEADKFRRPNGCFLALCLGKHFVACGGIRRFDAGTAEVKRMFVEPQARRSGYGRTILSQLESKARELGYQLLRMETGLRQPEAIALYERAGYHRIPAYGEFKDSPLSVCFEKSLAADIVE